jgi:C4-type Zn-finger protein
MREANMAKYLTRKCPECSESLGILIVPHSEPAIDRVIDGYCSRCGYEIHWLVIAGGKKSERLKLVQDPWLRLISSGTQHR